MPQSYPRPYQPSDACGLDRLLYANHSSGVRLDRDRIIVSGKPERLSGCLVWRPTGFIHQLILPHTIGIRSVLQVLVQAACDDATSIPHPMRQAAFLIDPDNLNMLRFVQSLPQVREERGRLFLIPLAEGTRL